MGNKIIQIIQKNTGDNLLPKTMAKAVYNTSNETLENVEAGAQVNLIESISVNNIEQEIDVNKNVNLTIPDAQIQSDWAQNDTSAKDYIKSKPTFATVATSGSYNDLIDKPVNPSVPTNLSSFVDDLGSSPVHTHSQYVTDISGKEDILKAVNVLNTSGTITLADNSINTITPTDTITFSLPTITDNTKFHQILIQVNLTSVVSITLGTSNFIEVTPDMSKVGEYNLIYEYRNSTSEWTVGCLQINSNV